jgi:DNA-binding IclR family transcriptional regulator
MIASGQISRGQTSSSQTSGGQISGGKRRASDPFDDFEGEDASETASAAGQGVARVAAILRALGERAQGGARLTDICLATGLSKSTAHRLLGLLKSEGLVETDAGTGLFYLGFDMCILGAAAANRYDLVQVSRPAIENLERLSEDTTYLSVQAGDDAICIDRVVGRFPIKVLVLGVGDRRPLGVGAGSLALLSAMPDNDIQDVLTKAETKIGAYPQFGRDLILKMVVRTRKDGYAFNDGLIIPGMCAIGVPILDSFNRPIAALSVAAITDRMQAPRRRQLVAWLQEAAAHLGDRINLIQGGKRPEPAGPGAAPK